MCNNLKDSIFSIQYIIPVWRLTFHKSRKMPFKKNKTEKTQPKSKSMLYNLSSSGAQKSSGVGRILQRDMVAQRKHCAMIGPSPGMPPPLFCSVLHSYTVCLPQMSFACLFSEQSFCCMDAEMEFGCPFAQVAELPIKDMLTCRSCLTAF